MPRPTSALRAPRPRPVGPTTSTPSIVELPPSGYRAGMNRLPALLLVACSSTTTKHHETQPTVTGAASAIQVVCDTSETCEVLPSAKSSSYRTCSEFRAACKLIETTGGRPSVLLDEPTGMTPLVFDRPRGIYWLVLGNRILGVTTMSSELPGRRVAAPAEVADFKGVDHHKVVHDELVVFKHGRTFRLWDLATPQVIEAPIPPREGGTEYGGKYVIGVHAIGFCELDDESMALRWASIDIDRSLSSHAPQVTSGAEPTKDRNAVEACAAAHANPR